MKVQERAKLLKVLQNGIQQVAGFPNASEIFRKIQDQVTSLLEQVGDRSLNAVNAAPSDIDTDQGLRRRIESGDGNGDRPFKRHTDRLGPLRAALEQAGMTVQVFIGEEEKNTLRGQGYHTVIVDDRTTIFICDRTGEATFIVHGILPTGTVIKKNDLISIVALEEAINPRLTEVLDWSTSTAAVNLQENESDVRPPLFPVGTGSSIQGVHVVEVVESGLRKLLPLSVHVLPP